MLLQPLIPIIVLWGSVVGQSLPPGISEKLPLVDRLPAATTHYIFRAGGESFSEKLKGTPAAEVLAEDEVKELLKSFEELMTKTKDKELRSAWRHLIASCHGDVVSAHIRVGEGEPQVLTVRRQPISTPCRTRTECCSTARPTCCR